MLFLEGMQVCSKISEPERGKMWELTTLFGLLDWRALTYAESHRGEDLKAVFWLLEKQNTVLPWQPEMFHVQREIRVFKSVEKSLHQCGCAGKWLFRTAVT